MRRIGLVLFVAVALFWSEGVTAQPLPAEKAAAAAAKVGLAAVRTWSQNATTKIAPSTLSPETRAAAVERGLERYQSTVNSYAAAQTAMQANKELVGGVATLAAFAAPPLAVPIILTGAATAIAHDKATEMIAQQGEVQGRRHLAAIRKDLMKEAHVDSYLSLVENEDLLRRTLNTHSHLLGDIDARAEKNGDPALKELAIDVLVNTAKNTSEAALMGVAGMNSRFENFVVVARNNDKAVKTKIDDLGQDIEAMSGDLLEMADTVERLDREIETLGTNQAVVADFVFSSLPPAEKVAAIRAGMMEGRIVCPPEQADCDRRKIRGALIERFEAEATMQDRVATAGKIVEGIGNVQAIASNLGIELGEEGNKVLSAGANAAKAYIGFMAGDYLGAVASITGVLGNRPDPDADRFKAMIAYLDQQFAAVNKTLKEIQAGQQQILGAIGDVSKQLNDVYLRLDSRLKTLEYELMVVSEGVKILLWENWKPCWSVYSSALSRGGGNRLVNRTTLGIVSLEAADELRDARAAQAETCLETANNDLASLSKTEIFGNFLDIDRMINVDQAVIAAAANAAELRKMAAVTEEQRRLVINPTVGFIRTWSDRVGIPRDTALAALSDHARTLEELEALKVRLGNGWRFDCDQAEIGPVRDLVCIDGNEVNTANALLGSAMSADVLLQLTGWLRVAVQIDALRFVPAGPLDWTSIANARQSKTGPVVLRQLAAATHLAMSGVNRNYGGLTASAVVDAIMSGTFPQNCAQSISPKANPYLAENIAIILLRSAATVKPDVGIAEPPFETVYARQLAHASSDQADRFEPLYALFGRGFEFLSAENGKIVMRVPITVAEGGAPAVNYCPSGEAEPPAFVELPMPMPSRLALGEFDLPPTFDRLKASRDAVIDMYLSMELGRSSELAQAIH